MTDECEFDYSGHLIFNLFSTRIRSENHDIFEQISNLISLLPEYTQGTPESPGEGFFEIDLLRHAESEDELPYWLVDELENWNLIQYTWESYNSTEAYIPDRNETDLVYVRSQESVDMFFHSSGITLFRGKESATERAKSRIQKHGKGDLLIENVKLDIRSVLHRLKYEQDSYDERLGFDRVTQAQFRGVDASTEKLSVSGTDLFTDSVTSEALQSGRVVSIHGKFQIDKFDLLSNVSEDRIFVKAVEDLKDLSPASRLTLSLSLCRRILDSQKNIESDRFK